jgi:hypothetical protein
MVPVAEGREAPSPGKCALPASSIALLANAVSRDQWIAVCNVGSLLFR